TPDSGRAFSLFQGLALAALISQTLPRRHLRHVMVGFSTGCVLSAAWGLVTWIRGISIYDLLGRETIGPARFALPGADANEWALILALGLPFWLWLASEKTLSMRARLGGALSAALIIAAIPLSASRTGLIAMAVATTSLLWT